MGGHAKRIGLPSLYLLDVVIQSDDFQRGREVGTGGDSRTHRGGLAHVALIGGKLEIRRLVVLIQDLDNKVGKGRKAVTVVLFGLKTKTNAATVSLYYTAGSLLIRGHDDNKDDVTQETRASTPTPLWTHGRLKGIISQSVISITKKLHWLNLISGPLRIRS